MNNPNYGNYRYLITPKFEIIKTVEETCGDDKFREILNSEEQKTYKELSETYIITNKKKLIQENDEIRDFEKETNLPGYSKYAIFFKPVNNITIFNKSNKNYLKEVNGKYRLTSDDKKINMVPTQTILESVRGSKK